MKYINFTKWTLGVSFAGFFFMYSAGGSDTALGGLLALGWIIGTPIAVYLLHQVDKEEDSCCE